MKKEVVVLDADKKQCRNLCSLLTGHTYRATPINSFSNMERYLGKSECRVIVVNLDSVAVTNKSLKTLKRKKPLINIIALSGRQFHPELEEALREYISVCLTKPLDADELIYWLRATFENNEKPI